MKAESKGGLPVLEFADAGAFEAWLATTDAAAVWVKIAKAGCTRSRLTQAAAIDAAVCHGWIDGQIGGYDESFFLTRFTPRKANSRWSELNCRRVERLIAEGRMTGRGLAQVEAAQADGRWAAAYPGAARAETPADFRAALAAHPEAEALYARLDGANRYALLYRLHHAGASDRAAMIARFVAMLARGDVFHRKPSKGR